ncbi:spindle checkpoint protein MAD2 [Paracoccidioides brasiliensis Pb18]|uniref:HORMA domain-containing protein n=1 Tax=Paracoccidioides brasiliensis (strain Pb18) TaxID=502780 RepID=C1GGI5_PARBD|nr:spindle checkpoint protein MAD2 [Paracoccidioides brasiliensis Pb18]EEH50343.2 hypothetical protein PADG_06422 [Paracoccidioides brasiliensis Pb18]ODH46663.1 hypothetical protein GX48_07219 [Paracoccidioides brasiliensis]
MATQKDKSKVHKLSLKGSSKLVAEFFEYSIHSILFQRGVYPADDFTAVKKYGLNMLVSSDDQVKAYIKKIMSQLNKWMIGGKISKLVIVITNKESGEHVERWQFDVQIFNKEKSSRNRSGHKAPSDNENTPMYVCSDYIPPPLECIPHDSLFQGLAYLKISKFSTSESPTPTTPPPEKSEKEIQEEIQAIFRQITASVTFLPVLDGNCTFNVLVYADADSEVPMEWGDSDAKEIKNGEKVQLRSFSTSNHRVDTLVSYRLAD